MTSFFEIGNSVQKNSLAFIWQRRLYIKNAIASNEYIVIKIIRHQPFAKFHRKNGLSLLHILRVEDKFQTAKTCFRQINVIKQLLFCLYKFSAHKDISRQDTF